MMDDDLFLTKLWERADFLADDGGQIPTGGWNWDAGGGGGLGLPAVALEGEYSPVAEPWDHADFLAPDGGQVTTGGWVQSVWRSKKSRSR